MRGTSFGPLDKTTSFEKSLLSLVGKYNEVQTKNESKMKKKIVNQKFRENFLQWLDLIDDFHLFSSSFFFSIRL